MTKLLCDIYKTKKKDEMYLYIERKSGLEAVPEALMEMFGKPELAMTMILTPEKKLGRADIHRVLAELNDKGFYLQMPPPKEPQVLDLFTRRDKD